MAAALMLDLGAKVALLILIGLCGGGVPNNNSGRIYPRTLILSIKFKVGLLVIILGNYNTPPSPIPMFKFGLGFRVFRV